MAVFLIKGDRTNVHEKDMANKHRKSVHKHKSKNKSEKPAVCNQGRLNWDVTDSSNYF